MRRLVALLMLLGCDAYRVLMVFPVSSRSHTNLGEGYLRHLLAAGHEVTYITPTLADNSHKNLRQIVIWTEVIVKSVTFDLTKIMNKEIPNLNLEQLLQFAHMVGNYTLFNEDVQKLLHDQKEQFDVVILQWAFSEVYCGIAAIFDCPVIWASTMDPHGLVLSLISEDPNPAYVPSYKSTAVPPFNFQQRVQELWMFLYIKYHTWFALQKQALLYEAAFSSAAAVRGHKLPPYHEARHNASLVFGNSHASTGSAISLPQNYIPIAGFHIDENVKPLPEDLQSVMDNAKHGVIFFSMGSILSSTTLSSELKWRLIEMFSHLKQTIIWKLEDSPGNLPENVHLVGYAPQQSILAHQNCILFITHGGLLSNTEAVHFGVPIIGIPVFADQFLNIDRAVHKGYAKRVHLNHDLPTKLKEAIEDVLEDPKYSTRVAELSLAYHDRAVAPGRELAHWVAHVARTRGAPHLRSPALLLPWYQKMYLDLLALVVIVTVISYLILKRLVTFIKLDKNKKNN